MAVNPLDAIRGGPTPTTRSPLTAVVTKTSPDGPYVAPIGGDHRTPIGPCRGGTGLAVGDPCVLLWTQELPWVLS